MTIGDHSEQSRITAMEARLAALEARLAATEARLAGRGGNVRWPNPMPGSSAPYTIATGTDAHSIYNMGKTFRQD